MFKYIREDMSQNVTRAILVCLVLGFASWGLHGAFNPSTDVYAKFNGYSVSQKELARFIETMPQDVKIKLAQDKNLANKFNKDAAQIILNRKILLDRLKTNKFSYDSADITSLINQINEQYGNVANYLKTLDLNSNELIRELKDNATIKLTKEAINNSQVDWPSYDKLIEKLASVVKNIQIIPVNVTQKQPSQSDLQSYYNENKSKYYKPEVADINVIKFSASNFISKLALTETDLVNFYNTHVDWYSKPAFIITEIYQLEPGFSNQAQTFLSQEQITELKNNNQTLGAMSIKRFEENTTDPNLYRLLNGITVGKSEFTTYNNAEVLVVVKDKKLAETPDFETVKEVVRSDLVKAKLRTATDNIRDAFISITRGDTNDLAQFAALLTTESSKITIDGSSWYSNNANIGKTFYSEDNDGNLYLKTLKAISKNVPLTFSQAKEAVVNDYNEHNFHELAMAQANKILMSKPKSIGKVYDISNTTKQILNLDMNKLLAMQFYNGQDSKILISTDNKYFVAILRSTTISKSSKTDNSVFEKQQLQKIFFNEILK